MGSAEIAEEIEVGEEIEEVTEETEELETGDEISEGEESEEEEVAELEEWEKTGEEDEKLPDVPVETHIKAKKKWKRREEAKDSEIEQLKAEVEKLKSGGVKTTEELKRPDPLDFENDDEYEDAREQYILKKIELKNKQQEVERKQQEFASRIKMGVDDHFERVESFVEERNIDRDVYRAAENVFVQTLDEFFPGKGEDNADYFLSMLGEGSEKIPYFLGRNKAKLAEFKNLLKEDPGGIKAAMFLGRENLRLNGGATTKPKTKAPKPAADAAGSAAVKGTANEKALRKKYNDFHKSGESSKAWDIKVQARKLGINTSEWAKA